MSHHPLVNIATRAARRAGDLIVRHIERVPDLKVDTKGPNDFVSEVDRAAEREIVAIIHRAHPEHDILAEEGGLHPAHPPGEPRTRAGSSGPRPSLRGEGAEFRWVIDPLDGTTNYLHQYLHFAVSIAVEHRGRVEHAVVYDPIRQELFTASRGGGASLDGRRIRASRQDRLDGAFIGTGLSPRARDRLPAQLALEGEILARGASLRRSGSAALDLAYVACGRLDAFWEVGLARWDLAAGVLLVREAGGLVSAPDGSESYLETGEVVAAGSRLFRPLVQRTREALGARTATRGRARAGQAKEGEP